MIWYDLSYINCPISDDPEERNDISAENPVIVDGLRTRLQQLYRDVAEVDMDTTIPVEDARAEEYNGIWTPGWCWYWPASIHTSFNTLAYVLRHMKIVAYSLFSEL